MVLKGSLETLSLTSVFQFIAGRAGTGSVWISDDTRELYIYFERGNIRLVATGRKENYRLDAYLIKTLRASSKDVRECIEKGKRCGKRPESALMDAGLASQEDIEAAVRLWIEEQLFEIAEWRKGQFKFMPGYRPHAKTDELQETCDILIPVNAMLLTLARRQSEWQTMLERFPDERAIFEITRIGPEDLGSCVVPLAWLEEAKLFDGSRSIAEIASESILTRFELYQLLIELRYRGLVVTATKDMLIEHAENARSTGDIVSVMKFHENALRLDPDDVRLRQKYARILQNMNCAQEAFEQFRRLGDWFVDRGNYGEASHHFRSALALRPDSADVTSRLAELYEIRGELQKGLDLRARAAKLIRKEKKFGQAAAMYADLIAREPETVKWYLRAADCCIETGEREEAVAYYEEAIARAAEAGRKDEIQSIFNMAMKRFAGDDKMERRLLMSIRKYSQQ